MVNGVDRMKALFRRRAAAAFAAGSAAADKGGNEVAAAMRYLAPRDGGELIRSIRVEPAGTISTRAGDRDFIGVVVKAGDASTVVKSASGGSFQNARIQEYGTKNMPANPYFHPAWRANRRRVRAAITRAIRKGWTG